MKINIKTLKGEVISLEIDPTKNVILNVNKDS